MYKRIYILLVWFFLLVNSITFGFKDFSVVRSVDSLSEDNFILSDYKNFARLGEKFVLEIEKNSFGDVDSELVGYELRGNYNDIKNFSRCVDVNFYVDKDLIRYEGEVKKFGIFKVDIVPIYDSYKYDKWSWWNSSLNNSKRVQFTNMCENYTINLNVSYDSNQSSTTFGDYRFVDKWNVSQLWYYQENVSDSSFSNFWVNVSNSTDCIYMYFNSSETTFDSYHNISRAFEYGLDFEYNDIGDISETDENVGYFARSSNVSKTFSNSLVYKLTGGTYYSFDIDHFDITISDEDHIVEWWSYCGDPSILRFRQDDNDLGHDANVTSMRFDPDFEWYDGSWHDDGYDISVNTWYKIRVQNYDFVADTYDIYVNNNYYTTGNMAVAGYNTIDVTEFRPNNVVLTNNYIDMFTIRKYCSPVPTYEIQNEYYKPGCECIIFNPVYANNSNGIDDCQSYINLSVNVSSSCSDIDYVNVSFLDSYHNYTSPSNDTFWVNDSGSFDCNTLYYWYVNTSCGNGHHINESYFRFTTESCCVVSLQNVDFDGYNTNSSVNCKSSNESFLNVSFWVNSTCDNVIEFVNVSLNNTNFSQFTNEGEGFFWVNWTGINFSCGDNNTINITVHDGDNCNDYWLNNSFWFLVCNDCTNESGQCNCSDFYNRTELDIWFNSSINYWENNGNMDFEVGSTLLLTIIWLFLAICIFREKKTDTLIICSIAIAYLSVYMFYNITGFNIAEFIIITMAFSLIGVSKIVRKAVGI